MTEYFDAITLLPDVDPEYSERLISKIAKFFESIHSTRDEITNTDPNTGSIRSSNREHAYHTDGNSDYEITRAFALYAKDVDPEGGGQSIFKSIRPILGSLKEKDIRTLLNHKVVFAHKDIQHCLNLVDKTFATHVLRRDPKNSNRLLLRYAHDEETNMVPLLGEGLTTHQESQLITAINNLNEAVAQAPEVIYPAKAGDFMLIFNTEVLHGRKAIISNERRTIWRWYLGLLDFYRGIERPLK